VSELHIADSSSWPELLTKDDLAKILRKSVRTIERRLEKGVFPVREIGGDSYVAKEDFWAVVKASKKAPNSSPAPVRRSVRPRPGRG